MKAIFLTLLTLSAAIQLRAGLITKPVMYEHNGAKLTGYLAYDDSVTAKGKAPGVLVFPEWWGLNDYIKGRADQLAKMGYVCVCSRYVRRRPVDHRSRQSKGAFFSIL
ncbi:MAG TPA: dienelactone hydrolase family protein, partial [Chthoniobacterales bacterium]